MGELPATFERATKSVKKVFESLYELFFTWSKHSIEYEISLITEEQSDKYFFSIDHLTDSDSGEWYYVVQLKIMALGSYWSFIILPRLC